MSCVSYQNCVYHVIPPRAWSRVQSPCTYPPLADLTAAEYAAIAHKDAFLRKGNVLQYKGNSSRLTAAQKYTAIATGKWTTQNTSWATQNTRGYTNPNVQSLKRVGNVTNVVLPSLEPTFLPVTCPDPPPSVQHAALPPSNIPGVNQGTELPPASVIGAADQTIPPVPDSAPPPPVVIQDLGTMLCNTTENICTGQTSSHRANTPCFPTTASNVPGRVQLLCWNDGTQTWFPRQRYIMGNSGDKFPTNYPLRSALHCANMPVFL